MSGLSIYRSTRSSLIIRSPVADDAEKREAAGINS